MAFESQTLGMLKPLGGGDPIPLKKAELVVGRRPSCDIRLDYENISGKHCQLSYSDGVWHVRDLGSTNGTTLNGRKFQGEENLMPEDQLGIAKHLFTVDYDPAAPVADSNQILKQELEEDAPPAHKPSLMELAGLARGEGRPA